MARIAVNYALNSKTARARLAPRRKAYYRQVGNGLTLGYYRRASGPGAWEIRELVAGKYRQRIIGAADDVGRADGRDVLTFEQAQARSTQPLPTAPTGKLKVRDAFELYLVGLASRSAHSEQVRARAENRIFPVLGDYLVTRLTKTQIEAWQAGLVRGDDADARRRSQDTANRLLTDLKAALNSAFADEANGIPADSAWRRVKPFRNVSAARPDHFDATQVRLLISKAATFDASLAALLEVGYLTGARYGELIAADVGHFAATTGTLQVRGKTGVRAIALSPEAVTFLREYTRNKLPTAPLLPRADGSRWLPCLQHRPVKRALASARLPASASFYTLRHSYISSAIENGMSLALIAENAGTSLLMIQRNYAHVLAATRRQLIDKHSPKLRRAK